MKFSNQLANAPSAPTEFSSSGAGEQTVRVLFGNSEGLLNGFISSMLEHRLPQRARVVRKEASTAERILHLAHREGFDLVILLLNNIRYDLSQASDAQAALAEAGLELIRRVKLLGGAPVIAMASSHWEMAPDLPERARSAGAVEFLSLPFQEAALAGAITQALSRTEARMLAGVD